MHLCTICQNKDNYRYHQVKEMMFGTGLQFDYKECTECGIISLMDPPADMQPYYADDYYSYIGLVSSPWWKNILKQIRLSIYLKFNINPPLYGEWLKRSNAQKSHKIADIGCGNGQILYEMAACGYQNLEGYDPFIERDLVINDSLKLFKKDIFEISSKNDFDMIMMHHSFEHMARPKEIMHKAYELLKPGGILLIRIPLADAQAWKDYGVHWVQLDAPRHFFIHTKKSMAILAEEAGFETERIVFDSRAFQFWGSELYKDGISLQEGKDLKRFTPEQIAAWEKRSKSLNTHQKGDQACFYLRKRGS